MNLHQLKSIIPQSLKNYFHLIQAVGANVWFGFPSRKIKVIGVTGTNGKTTTVQMITRILEQANFKVAMASTINFKLGEKEWVNKTKFTTLSPFAVQKFIKDAVKNKCGYLVLETSSHSLDQYRVWGVEYRTAVITNVTREHLDYHQTMEKYREAKLKLFQKAKVAIVNLDMKNPEEFLQYNNAVQYGYAVKNPNSPARFDSRSDSGRRIQIPNEIPNSKVKKVMAEDVELGVSSSSYKLQAISYKLNIPGLFNIENALAAISAGLSENISLEKMASALEKIQGVPGRMEYVPNEKGLNIIVDYAVTPDSLEKLYALVKEINRDNKKVIAVFGSCGERDRGKRPLMGEIVSRYADYVIITNEDPYWEEPNQIINEVFTGVIGKDTNNQETRNKQITNPKIEGTNCWRILDRREAIKKALQLAKPGDFVLVTGKGAEETMAIKDQRILWNDKKVILEILNSL